MKTFEFFLRNGERLLGKGFGLFEARRNALNKTAKDGKFYGQDDIIYYSITVS